MSMQKHEWKNKEREHQQQRKIFKPSRISRLLMQLDCCHYQASILGWLNTLNMYRYS